MKTIIFKRIDYMRSGDWYETIGSNAKLVMDILPFGWHWNGEQFVMRAAFPAHSAEMYLPKLEKAGIIVKIENKA